LSDRPGWIDVVAAGFAPGALLGTQLAGLIFFLNPGLPFAPGPVLRGIAVYASLLGGASLVLHLPLTWGRRRLARRWLPWALTLTLAAAALLDWTHASHFAYFLPAGINDRLIRTALWLTLGALISFYTALLHTLHRRPYGWRSRYGCVLIAVLSVYAMVERREAFQPRRGPTPRPAAVETGQRPQLLVIGIETATMDAVLPLAGQGRLPFLASLLQGGAHGHLGSIAPPQRDALWISLATGKYPSKHGVTGGRIYPADWLAPKSELRILPVVLSFPQWGTLGRGPSSPRIYPRTASTLWEILPRLGVPSGVVGWPAAGAAAGTLFSLSDRFFVGAAEPGSIRPPDLAERARLFRVEPREIDRGLRARFGPTPPPAILNALADDLWHESLALSLREQNPEAGAMFLALPGLREVSLRDFGGFNAFQFEGARDPASQAAAERVAGYYEVLDDFLAEAWKRGAAGNGGDGPRVLAVVSACGVKPEGREGTLDGAPDGVLLLYGEGIRPGALLSGARLTDLVSTLLYALGFPVARDFDGQVLTAAFDKRFLAGHPLTFFSSYEALNLAPAPPQSR
jgi:hypothetical protein